MALFTKGLIGAGIAGTVALGAMVTWDGGTTVISAKDKITEAATQIGVFKQNETALVSKVNSLKNEKATLTAEVATLKVELQAEKDKGVADKARIVELEAEIAAKNAQIAELETEIATLNTDLENAAGNTAETVERINALEAELNAANEQAEELQYTLDTTVLESPDQVAVDAALSNEDGTVNPTPIDPIVPPVTYPEIAMIGGTPIALTDYVSGEQVVLNKVESPAGIFNLTIVSDSGDGHTITIDGANAQTVERGGSINLGTNVDLDGKVLTVKNNFNGKTFNYTLANK